MIDWFCWLLIVVGLVLTGGSRFLHRRIGMPTAAWLIIGAAMLAIGLWRLDF